MGEPRYYLPSEVVLHNKPDDIWVSFLGKVYDVTDVIQEWRDDRITNALLASAGKDISKWFDRRTKELKYVISPVTGLKVRYTPSVSYVDAFMHPGDGKSLDAIENFMDDGSGWVGKCREIGNLTKRARPVRIINVLAPATHRYSLIWVASEEKMMAIIKRIEQESSPISSYTLKFEGRSLHMMKTLDENNIPDERDRFMQLGLTDDIYIPAIALYYNDNLK